MAVVVEMGAGVVVREVGEVMLWLELVQGWVW
jgi:hypothetical protein